MTLSLRLNDDDTMLIRKYAELNKTSVSELIRRTVLERIEDDLDVRAYEKAMAEYRKNPVSYSLDDVEKELGLQ